MCSNYFSRPSTALIVLPFDIKDERCLYPGILSSRRDTSRYHKTYARRLIQRLLFNRCLSKDGRYPYNFDYMTLPEIIWAFFSTSERQITNELLEPWFDIEGNIDQFWREYDSEDDWDWLSVENIVAQLEFAAMQWLHTLETLKMCIHEADAEMFNKEQWASRLNRLFVRLDIALVAGSDRLWPFLEFVHALTKLVSDLDYTLDSIHEGRSDNLDLLGLKDVPSRYHVLKDIIREAPLLFSDLTRDQPSKRSMYTVFDSIDPEKRTCIICAEERSELACHRASTAPGNLHRVIRVLDLDLDNGSAQLSVRKHCEKIPIPLPCGHVFCAGCIKRLLEEDGRLKCPFRDLDFGIHRSTAVLDMETYAQELAA